MEDILDELIAFLKAKDYADYEFYEMSDLIKFIEEFKANKNPLENESEGG